ncbi:MAG: ubiquinol-cytochrome C chaperone family protein [Alphaproteobacteria bacterium]
MLFKQKYKNKKHFKKIATKLYACALENTRKDVFYKNCGVPDSFDGRFDLLLLHIFIILHHIMDHEEYEGISQALFDVMFKDMDQTLREIGIGDVGVPKHMKRMMKAFNGRMYNYQVAISPDSVKIEEVEGLKVTSLEEAIARNLYGGRDVDQNHVNEMVAFVTNNIENLETSVDEIADGGISYINKFSDNEEEVEKYVG